MQTLEDNYNRIHDYLRISLTDNCNLRCSYCMPEEHYTFTPASQLMQAEEIEAIARIFVDQGVKKIRLTGGEPLVRKDAAAIILALSRLPVSLTLTTNGTRVHEFLPVLKKAGVSSLNISLDSLRGERFQLMTKRDQFSTVWTNIEKLVEGEFHVKINMVVIKGVNDDEICDFVEWTRTVPVHVRFIEFMPFSGNHWRSNQVVTCQEILQRVDAKYSFLPLEKEKNQTAKKFIVPGHAGTFAVISTMSANFCGDCNRMRLTADGKMKNCLFSEKETDLLTAFRRGDDIVPLLHQNIRMKARELGGQFTPDFKNLQAKDIHNRAMITIGG
jgi:GTP 3',8-cyclase